MFAWKEMKEGQTLADYNILSKSTLHLSESTAEGLLRLQGGGAKGPALFVDLGTARFLRCIRPVDGYGPSKRLWNLKGLNVEGICTNIHCEANGKLVLCPTGLGIFNVTDHLYDNQCPACGLFVKAEAYGFTNCWFMYEGRKAAPASLPTAPKSPSSLRTKIASLFTKCFKPDEPQIMRFDPSKVAGSERELASPWYKATDSHDEYSDGRNDVVGWEKLVIVAKELPDTRYNDKPLVDEALSDEETGSKGVADEASSDEETGSKRLETPVENNCPICFGKLGQTTTHITPCGHTFHEKCVSSWKKKGGKSCPMCRVPLCHSAGFPRALRSLPLLSTFRIPGM